LAHLFDDYLAQEPISLSDESLLKLLRSIEDTFSIADTNKNVLLLLLNHYRIFSLLDWPRQINNELHNLVAEYLTNLDSKMHVNYKSLGGISMQTYIALFRGLKHNAGLFIPAAIDNFVTHNLIGFQHPSEYKQFVLYLTENHAAMLSSEFIQKATHEVFMSYLSLKDENHTEFENILKTMIKTLPTDQCAVSILNELEIECMSVLSDFSHAERVVKVCGFAISKIASEKKSFEFIDPILKLSKIQIENTRKIELCDHLASRTAVFAVSLDGENFSLFFKDLTEAFNFNDKSDKLLYFSFCQHIAKIANHYFLPCFASILHTFREVFCEDSAKPDNFVSFEKLLQNKHHRIDIELFEIKIKCLDQILSIPYKNFDVLMIKNLNELFQLAFDYAFTQMPSIDIKCEPWQSMLKNHLGPLLAKFNVLFTNVASTLEHLVEPLCQKLSFDDPSGKIQFAAMIVLQHLCQELGAGLQLYIENIMPALSSILKVKDQTCSQMLSETIEYLQDALELDLKSKLSL